MFEVNVLVLRELFESDENCNESTNLDFTKVSKEGDTSVK